MSLTLVVLAAGMGSRYGGLKQIDPVGPSGETVLDYAVFDAMRAGFTRVLFVIRRDFEALFREKIGARYAGRVQVDYVFQSLDALPPGQTPPAGREKPWATGVPADKKLKAQELFNEGNAAMSDGIFPTAAEKYREAIIAVVNQCSVKKAIAAQPTFNVHAEIGAPAEPQANA